MSTDDQTNTYLWLKDKVYLDGYKKIEGLKLGVESLKKLKK